MKFGVCICVYNERDMLKACLKQFPKWIDRILVLISKKPWHGSNAPDAGRTELMLRNIKDRRLEVISNDWSTEAIQRSWGLGRLHDMDWVFIVDADEFYTQEGWEKLKLKLEKPDPESPVLTINEIITYWKTPQYKLNPGDAHKPVVAVDPKRTTIFDKRESVDMLRMITDVPMHHFSWVKSDDEVWQKIHNWSHAKDFDPTIWYNNVWLGWEEGMKNIHPYGGKGCSAVKVEPPTEIMEYFKH